MFFYFFGFRFCIYFIAIMSTAIELMKGLPLLPSKHGRQSKRRGSRNCSQGTGLDQSA